MSKDYERYKTILQRTADVNYSMAVLGWDQEVYMPSKGARHRAQQLATLSGIGHEMSTTKELGQLLQKLSSDKTLSDKEKRNVARSLRDYNNRVRYPKDFVELMSRTISEAFQAWQKAKHENKFEVFAPLLEKLVVLKKEECKLYGYKNHPYDALLDQYEPDATVADLDVLFADVRNQLVDFVKEISRQKQNGDAFMHKHYDRQKQWNFGLELLKQMHYDFDAGRQDISTHPFTTNFSPMDVRVTTRIAENDLPNMTWSCIHEGGHGLYEQGLPAEDYGLPTAEAISLGIHESQSRLWENNVGRSLAYWKYNYPKLQQVFPENLSGISLEAFYQAMNVVKPSLIRTSADELTYHFHIMIRYSIEKLLIGGKISVNDLPGTWNNAYKEYLGVDVPSDDRGVLQDIHWSHGSFGYFPTYSLGSFYAAQFFAKANADVPGLENEIENGSLLPLLKWLRGNIHQYGRFYTAEELCTKVTGEKLNFRHFMDYARKKYAYIYSLKNSAVK